MALSKSCEDKINLQINAELQAGYSYLALSQYFSRSDVALPNIAKFFEKSSDEEMQHAKNFIEYQNKRAGTCVFTNINAYNVPKDGITAECAFKKALEWEENIQKMLIELHDSGENDPHLQDYIASNFLDEQVQAIHMLNCKITKLKRVGDKVGLYMFDRDLE